MKRVSLEATGSSPLPKHQLFNNDEDSFDEDSLPSFSQSSTQTGHYFFREASLTSSSSHCSNWEAPHITDSESDTSENLENKAGNYDDMQYLDNFDKSSPDDPFPQHYFKTEQEVFKAALAKYIDTAGVCAVVADILEDKNIKEEVAKIVFSESHISLKTSLKGSKSILTSSKKDRSYLLSLTPRRLCEEFQVNSGPSFKLLLDGLLGITDHAKIYESQVLLNTIALLYSTVAKIHNRQATGYALLLTTSARDGGLREDSLGLFSCMVHPRTSQKYDKEVLSVGWDTKLRENLKIEKEHFEQQRETEIKIEELLLADASLEAVEGAKHELEHLKDSIPPQLQLVWDNLNLRTHHRFQRGGDSYEDSNLDWMASLWIKDRIDASHMQHDGMALKDIDSLSIKDMLPSTKEKDYVFRALVFFYSYRLVQRHPEIFKSIANCIKPCKAHQFQQAMDSKSEEFTGNLFTKSESSTEDLISMMSELQLNVNTFVDNNGVEHCFERKICSGDNKTEKNMHYGILRFTMQYQFCHLLS